MSLLKTLLAFRDDRNAALMAFLLSQREEQELADRKAAAQSDGMPILTAQDYARMIDGNGDGMVVPGAPGFKYPQRVLRNALPQFQQGPMQPPAQAPAATDTSVLQRIRDRMARTRDNMSRGAGMIYRGSKFGDTFSKYAQLQQGIPGSPNMEFEQFQPNTLLDNQFNRPRYL